MPTMFSAMLPTRGTMIRPRNTAEMPTSEITASSVPTNTSEITATAAVESRSSSIASRPGQCGPIGSWPETWATSGVRK